MASDTERDALVAELRLASIGIYLAAPEEVADDVSLLLRAAADALECPWIPLAERVPEEGDKVILLRRWVGGGFGVFPWVGQPKSYDYTHWQPARLPKEGA